MDKMAVVIMEKDAKTGFLQKELGSYSVEYDIDNIDRVFAVREGEDMITHLYLAVPGEFDDWEFNAILDNYGIELYEEIVLSIEEDEESYNPAWHLKFKFEGNDSDIENKLNEILEIHSKEISRVLQVIKELEDEYKS